MDISFFPRMLLPKIIDVKNRVCRRFQRSPNKPIPNLQETEDGRTINEFKYVVYTSAGNEVSLQVTLTLRVQ